MYKTKFGTPKTLRFNPFNQDEKRWCVVHITGFWGKKDDGTWFDQCAKGFKVKEECKIGE